MTKYMRVGSEEQISKLTTMLDDTRKQLKAEEKKMTSIAKEFMVSSERYESLSQKQRSLTGLLFAETNRGK